MVGLPSISHHRCNLTLKAFRLSKRQACSRNSLVTDPRVIYHTINPHPALSPVPTEAVPSSIAEQRESESTWRQLLIQGALAVLLPTDDLENGCLRALVAEIFAEMIIGNGISGKACEGWLLWEGITKIAEVLRHADAQGAEDRSHEASLGPLPSRLQHFGLVNSPVVTVDGPSQPSVVHVRRYQVALMTANGLFWMAIQYILLAATALRAVIGFFATSSSLPLRSTVTMGDRSTTDVGHQSPLENEDERLWSSKRPIVSMKLWSFASKLIELETRMPWLSGSISMLQWAALDGPGKVGNVDGVLDR